MSRKRSKNVISCQFPKFLETRIWGHRASAIEPGARGHKVTKAFRCQKLHINCSVAGHFFLAYTFQNDLADALAYFVVTLG